MQGLERKRTVILDEDQLTEIDFGWLCTKYVKYSKIQIASERQTIALGNIDGFFIFRSFILIQSSLSQENKGRDKALSILEKMKSEKDLLKIWRHGKSQSWHDFVGVWRTRLPGWEESLTLNKIPHKGLMTILWTPVFT